jgi:VRR-NUC domain
MIARLSPRFHAGTTEKTEQHDTVQLLTAIGARVYTLGTRRPRGARCPSCGTFVVAHQGTCQTAGLPDLLVFLPRSSQLLLIEQKTVRGRLTPAQEMFRDCCVSGAIAHVVGTADAVIDWLRRGGYVR